jgi:hypothetical protein
LASGPDDSADILLGKKRVVGEMLGDTGKREYN